MEPTLIRERPLSALLIGAAGRHVLMVVTAFESRRINTLRADDVAAACDQIASEMPHVVVALLPTTEGERDVLADCALAVGAVVVHIDPSVDEAALKTALDDAVQAAIHRKLLSDAAEIEVRRRGAPDLLPSEDLDDGWD